MTIRGIKEALWRTVEDVNGKHTLQMAAALSYYFVLSIFPALILLSAIVAYLPVAGLFDQAISLMSGFVPPDSMDTSAQSVAVTALELQPTTLWRYCGPTRNVLH